MVVKLVITVGFVVTISVAVVVGGLSLASYLASTALAPHVKLSSLQFSGGACQTDYFLFWQTGQHRLVSVNFTLSNDGLSKAKVSVAFTVDGATSSKQDFFIERGQSAWMTAQFQVNDCAPHHYWAQMTDVQAA